MDIDNRDLYIQEIVQGKSFLEVGGLWGEVNEKITIAHRAGAKILGAIDIWKPDSEWWRLFRTRCVNHGISEVSEIVGSIDNLQTVQQAGSYDVVHCSGVLYHCPNPFLTISNLRDLTKEILILTAAVMPPVIENENGRIELSADTAILVPTITDEKRKIVDSYIQRAYGGGAYGVNTAIDSWVFSDGSPNYGPWWWLWTAEYLERLVSVCGFTIVKSAPQFNGTGHSMMLRKVPIDTQNYGLF